MMNIYEKLLKIQTELKAPKGQKNNFGNYNYRSCEDILEALKPLCEKHKTALTISDEMVMLGTRFYIQATASLYDVESDKEEIDFIRNTAYAREEETKKGMDGSQITGACSSYARKYALNGLFCIDDTKDADTDAYKKQEDKTKEQDQLKERLLNKEEAEGLHRVLIAKGLSEEVIKTTLLKGYKVDSTDKLTTTQYVAVLKNLGDK